VPKSSLKRSAYSYSEFQGMGSRVRARRIVANFADPYKSVPRAWLH
jgi:hypothetical protein